MCVLWGKDAGALWVDITQDAQGGIMGVMGGEGDSLRNSQTHL